MAQKGFFYDMTVCTSCKTCQIACNDKNGLTVGTLFRKVHLYEGGKYPKPWVYNISISCNHCSDPKCAVNCPTGAIYKRADGIVAHNADKCIGCKLCTWSCPYEAPKYIEDRGVAGKCDFCVDLIDKGENPACVDACLMRALHYGELEELARKYGGSADAKGLPDSSITKPSLLIKPNKEAER